MARVVYLHIGAPKTGTTYLQDRLRRNRETLGHHGVHYPLGLLADHFKPAIDLIRLPWGGTLEEAEGQWDTLMRRVRRHDGIVIVGHELLSVATREQIDRAMADLADGEVHIVFSARDIARQVPAEWQEGIKNGRRWRFRKLLDLVEPGPEQRPNLWFWRSQSLPGVLSRWSAGLPPDQVHLVTVPQPGAGPDVLWQRFCTVFGIDPAWAPRDSPVSNPAMGAAETTVLRRLNAMLADTGLDFAARQSLVKEVLAHQTLAERETGHKATLPPRMYPWAQGIASSWIEWAEGSGIDVVGDLEDLRPAAPPEGKWRSPDRPDPEELAAAALDALAAMTQEAARRGDPERQLVAKVGRAARRLRGTEE